MAASSASLRGDGIAGHAWPYMAALILGVAIACGYAVAAGETAGLFVGISIVCGLAVLFDFRAGTVLLVLMLPIAASALFPRSLMEVSGLNPLNLLAVATLGSYLLVGRLQRAAPLVPQPVVWLYILPMIGAALIGTQYVHLVPSFFYESDAVQFVTARQYLTTQLAKPLVTVAVALLLGAAAARSQKAERFIIPMALSVWLITLFQIGFVVWHMPSLSTLASADSRGFYEPIGMHANSFGRLHLFAFAILLFVWAETKRPNLKLFLMLTIGLLSIAIVLTFSRAAIGGAGLVGALFLAWKFNARSLALAMIVGAIVMLLFGEALHSRLTKGFDEGADAISAGRLGIWTAMIPEVARSPLWGRGLNSTLWSFPVVNEAILPVGHVHNAYLQALLDMGVIGLALVLGYWLHVWRGFRALGSSPWLSPEMRGFFQGATAALLAYFATCVVGSSLFPEPETAYLWIAIGLMYGLRGRRPAG